ncbi:MAG: hypothetical protein IKU07_00165 [Oscillospiraceae bacterium]|nr:hypothetical protein [Oscillospiraceae bacterium]
MAQQPEIQYIRYYADGSAARKAEFVAPFKTLRLPKLKKKRTQVTVHYIDPVAILGILVSVIMLALLVVGVVQLTTANREAKQLERYVHSLEQQNARLQGDFDQALKLEDVQRTADALGLVPMEQVTHITMQLPVVEEPETPDAWDRFVTFLTALFA